MYCTHCGNEISDNAVVCPKCGVPTDNYNVASKKGENNGIKMAIKIFLIIACVFSIFSFFIPLAWCLPMTIYYWKRADKGEKVGTAFKVCSLIFVSLIGGILMLCDN